MEKLNHNNDIEIKLLSNRRFTYANRKSSIVITAENNATEITVLFPDEYEDYSKRVDFVNSYGKEWTEGLYTPEFKKYKGGFNKTRFHFTLPTEVTTEGELRMQFLAYKPDKSMTTVPFEVIPIDVINGVLAFKKSARSNPDLLILAANQSTEALFSSERAVAKSERAERLSEEAQKLSKKAEKVSAKAEKSAKAAEDLSKSAAETAGAAQTGLQSEILRAVLAEAQLTGNLSAEIDRAIRLEAGITAELNAESDRARLAESQLAGNLSIEIERATQAESAIITALNTETARATAADTDLQMQITEEQTRAAAVEKDLTDLLLTEAAERIQGDVENSAAIAAETERAETTENEIVTKLTADITAEAQRAIAAEQAIRQIIIENAESGQSDWNESDPASLRYISNKPQSMPASDVPAWAKEENKPRYTTDEIGAEPAFSKNTAFNKDFGTVENTVCEGNDERLSDARPASDVHPWAKEENKPAYTATEVGAEPEFNKKTAFNKDFGTTADTVCQGNDERLSDSRPASDVRPWAKEENKPTYTADEVGAEPAFSKNNAFNKDFGTEQGTVCEGNDGRLSDSRPASDVQSWAKQPTKPAYTANEVEAEPAFVKNTAFNKDFGTVQGSVCEGNDGRLSDSRPASDVQSWAKQPTKPSYTASEVGAEPAFNKNTAFNKNFGTTQGSVCEGNDGRLKDARTPLQHSHGAADLPTNLLSAGENVTVSRDASTGAWTVGSKQPLTLSFIEMQMNLVPGDTVYAYLYGFNRTPEPGEFVNTIARKVDEVCKDIGFYTLRLEVKEVNSWNCLLEVIDMDEADYSRLGGAGTYDKTIRTQEEFDELIASYNWLDAKTVAFIGSFNGPYETITIPMNVVKVQGFDCKIKFNCDSISNLLTSELRYNSFLTIDGITLEYEGPQYYLSAFYGLANLTNCHARFRILEGWGCGFNECTNVSRCTALIEGDEGSAFSGCFQVSDCAGNVVSRAVMNDRGNAIVFEGCEMVSNCVATAFNFAALQEKLKPSATVKTSATAKARYIYLRP